MEQTGLTSRTKFDMNIDSLNSPACKLAVKEHVLKAIRLNHHWRIDEFSARQILNHTDIQYEICERTRDLIIRLVTQIYAGEPQRKTISAYPANWWQALKQRFAPKWFLRRYPVKTTLFTITVQDIFPDILPDIPGQYTTKLVVTCKQLPTPP